LGIHIGSDRVGMVNEEQSHVSSRW